MLYSPLILELKAVAGLLHGGANGPHWEAVGPGRLHNIHRSPGHSHVEHLTKPLRHFKQTESRSVRAEVDIAHQSPRMSFDSRNEGSKCVSNCLRRSGGGGKRGFGFA